jgi:hypothetical protein
MSKTFAYDVFLSYSSRDKKTVHALAERLKKDGLRVWLDAWMIQPGDSIPLKIQHGLEQSRVLLMCMSQAYFGSEWGKLEHHTLIFRDPTNAQRRFIPLLIGDCTRPDIIAQFAYVDWRTPSDEAYEKLLAACREENAEGAKPAAREEKVSVSKELRIDIGLDIINKIEYLYGMDYGSPKPICDKLHIDPIAFGAYLEELNKSGLMDVQKGTNSPQSLPNGINNVRITGKAFLKTMRI